MKRSGDARGNRAFAEMRTVAVGWLADKDPVEIARNAGVAYDEEGKRFAFSSLGTEVGIDYPEYRIAPELDEWQQLTILHYMNWADGAPLTGRWMTMREVKDGLIRGDDFDRRCESAIRDRLCQISEGELSERCLRIGGRIVDSNADFAMRFDFLPRYPMLLKLWYADEDFPASGKLLLDESADHYLSIEDAVTVGQLVMEKLVGTF